MMLIWHLQSYQTGLMILIEGIKKLAYDYNIRGIMSVENLSLSKSNVMQYVDSGQYDDETQTAIDALKIKIIPLLGTPNLTVCFDIDDTAIRMEQYWRSKDYAGTNETITESMIRENEPANVIIQNFNFWCMTNGINCIFLTGRREKYRVYTENLLKNAGYLGYYLLDMKPTESTLDDATFKAQQIDKYIAQGLVIAATVGDQSTDMQNNATCKCQIPNKWYDVTYYEFFKKM